MTIFRKAQLAIAFLSATLGNLVLVILLNAGNNHTGSLLIAFGTVLAFYAALCIAFERNGTYRTYLLCFALGVTLFALTIFYF